MAHRLLLRRAAGGDEGANVLRAAHVVRQIGAEHRQRADHKRKRPVRASTVVWTAVGECMCGAHWTGRPAAMLPLVGDERVVLHVSEVGVRCAGERREQREQPAHIDVRIVVSLGVKLGIREAARDVRKPRKELVDAREYSTAHGKVRRVDVLEVTVSRVLLLQRPLVIRCESTLAHNKSKPDRAGTPRLRRGVKISLADPRARVRSARIGDDAQCEKKLRCRGLDCALPLAALPALLPQLLAKAQAATHQCRKLGRRLNGRLCLGQCGRRLIERGAKGDLRRHRR